jgi:hypothetical protein
MGKRVAIGPMHVLHGEHARLRAARPSNKTGHCPAIAGNASAVVHCIVDRAKMRRLRNVQQIGEEYGILVGEEIFRQRCFYGNLHQSGAIPEAQSKHVAGE